MKTRAPILTANTTNPDMLSVPVTAKTTNTDMEAMNLSVSVHDDAPHPAPSGAGRRPGAKGSRGKGLRQVVRPKHNLNKVTIFSHHFRMLALPESAACQQGDRACGVPYSTLAPPGCAAYEG